jgi:hypothetical protein
MRWLILLFVPLQGSGQSQEVQQLMLNIQKLAQMKATYKAMVNGYRTLEAGYNNLNGYAKGSFNLHKEYLDRLLMISPTVQQYPKVDAIVQRQKSLVKEYRDSYRQLQVCGMLSVEELVKLRGVLSEIIIGSESSIDELIDVLTPGKLRMNDEERISVINRIDGEVSGYLERLRAAVAQYSRLSDARAKRKKEAEGIKALYGIKH